MEIKVLGMGCVNCNNLEKNVFTALAELNLDADVEKVDDMGKIMFYGALRTPALIVNGKMKISGRVATVAELKEIFVQEK